MNLILLKDIIVSIITLFFVGLSFYYYQKMMLFRKIYKKKKLEIGRLRRNLNFYKNLPILERFDENIIVTNEHLNERQKEIVLLMIRGYNYTEMSDRLFIAPTTIKYHIRNIFKVYDVKNRTQLFEKIAAQNIEVQSSVA